MQFENPDSSNRPEDPNACFFVPVVVLAHDVV